MALATAKRVLNGTANADNLVRTLHLGHQDQRGLAENGGMTDLPHDFSTRLTPAFVLFYPPRRAAVTSFIDHDRAAARIERLAFTFKAIQGSDAELRPRYRLARGRTWEGEGRQGGASASSPTLPLPR